MSISLDTVSTEVLQRLGDSSARIWTANEIDSYIQEGYDELTMSTGCLFAMAAFPDYAAAFTHTQEWEREYLLRMGEDFTLAGPAQFTAEWERDYLDNADGPANHTQPWEYNDGHVETTYVSALVDLPEDLYEIERATWNDKRLAALRSRDLEGGDSRYELNKGQVEGYVQDKDGLRRLRKWRVPSAAYEPYEFDDDSDDGQGLIRFLGDIGSPDVDGDFGDLCQVPNVEVLEDFGILGEVVKPQNTVKIEYRRRGLPLSVNQDFEIPDRYVKYLRWFALWKALEREGDGQELGLAAHYRARWQTGLQRITRRMQTAQTQRKFTLGGAPSIRRKAPPRARLPYQYGQVVR